MNNLIDAAGYKGHKIGVDRYWKDFKQIFDQETEDKQKFSNVFNSAIEAYFRCKQNNSAFKVMLEMQQAQLIPTVKNAGVFGRMFSFANPKSKQAKEFGDLLKNLDR